MMNQGLLDFRVEEKELPGASSREGEEDENVALATQAMGNLMPQEHQVTALLGLYLFICLFV